MKVTPTKGPVITAVTGATSQSAEAARAKAVAILEGRNNKPSAPTPTNPNNVSPEEMSAVQAPRTAPVEPTTEEPQATETPEVKSPPVKEDPELANKFALLAKKERQLQAKNQQRLQALQQKEEQLKAKEAELQALEQKYAQGYISAQELQTDTLRVLAERGITYDQLTEQQLNAAGVNPQTQAHINRLQQTIEKLESKLQKIDTDAETRQQEDYKSAVQQIRYDVDNLVKSDENFELIKTQGQQQEVVNLIEMTFKEEGRIMSIEEAAQAVEDELTDRALKLIETNKLKKRLAPPVQTAPVEPKTPSPQSQQPQTMKTLTNANSSTRTLSAKERAILAFQGKLK